MRIREATEAAFADGKQSGIQPGYSDDILRYVVRDRG